MFRSDDGGNALIVTPDSGEQARRVGISAFGLGLGPTINKSVVCTRLLPDTGYKLISVAASGGDKSPSTKPQTKVRERV